MNTISHRELESSLQKLGERSNAGRHWAVFWGEVVFIMNTRRDEITSFKGPATSLVTLEPAAQCIA